MAPDPFFPFPHVDHGSGGKGVKTFSGPPWTGLLPRWELPVVVARAAAYPFRMSTHPAENLYEQDFFAWTQLQARELRRFARTRPNLPLDLEHLAEEVADLGKEQRNALRSWTARIIEHLLLLDHFPAECTDAAGSLMTARRRVGGS